MTRLLPVTFVLLLLLTSALHADPAQDALKQADAVYADGKFSDAMPLYQSALDKGLHHWVVYYNLGNAAYKSGQLGKAIVNYERAFRLNSGERDVIYNLTLATGKAGDPIVPTDALPAIGWKLFYDPSLNTLSLVASLIFLGLCTLGGLALLGRRVSSDAAIGLGVLMVAAGLWLGLRAYQAQKSVGVITTSVAEVRSGPNTTYPANFTVPEGHHVLILDEEEPVSGWVEVGVPQEGLKGWIPDASVEKVGA